MFEKIKTTMNEDDVKKFMITLILALFGAGVLILTMYGFVSNKVLAIWVTTLLFMIPYSFVRIRRYPQSEQMKNVNLDC